MANDCPLACYGAWAGWSTTSVWGVDRSDSRSTRSCREKVDTRASCAKFHELAKLAGIAEFRQTGAAQRRRNAHGHLAAIVCWRRGRVTAARWTNLGRLGWPARLLTAAKDDQRAIVARGLVPALKELLHASCDARCCVAFLSAKSV